MKHKENIDSLLKETNRLYRLGFAQKLLSFGVSEECREAIEKEFPELRESEDERIRKFLLRLAERCNENSIDFMGEIKKKDVLAWLEKQKEPHFTKRNKLFDKCVENCDPKIMKKVSDEIDEMLQKEQKPVEYLNKDKVYAIMKKLHDLAFSQRIPIDSDEYKKIGEITSDVRSLLDYPIEQKSIDYEVELKKCKDNPLYFFDKYVTVKLKQKPAEWSEEDEGELQNAIDALEFLGKKGVYKSESGYDAALQAASWLKFLPERFVPQPKQEWSEKDKLMIKCCERALEFYWVNAQRNKNGVSLPAQFDIGGYIASPEEVESWLKTLLPRSKQEWSKEDEEMLKSALDAVAIAFDELGKEGKLKDDPVFLWLKSLRPQSHWKPSEEQMKALLKVVDKARELHYSSNSGYDEYDVLRSLYKQLKEL